MPAIILKDKMNTKLTKCLPHIPSIVKGQDTQLTNKIVIIMDLKKCKKPSFRKGLGTDGDILTGLSHMV
jgi:hypothetical protein